MEGAFDRERSDHRRWRLGTLDHSRVPHLSAPASEPHFVHRLHLHNGVGGMADVALLSARSVIPRKEHEIWRRVSPRPSPGPAQIGVRSDPEHRSETLGERHEPACSAIAEVPFATLETAARRACLFSALALLRRVLRPLYCRAGCKRSRPCGFLKTPPRDLGGVCVCRPLSCKDLAKASMLDRVSARAEVITGRRGRGRQQRRFGPKVSPSLGLAGYGVMRGLSPL